MVVPVGEGSIQEMHLIEKISLDDEKITKHGKFHLYLCYLINKKIVFN